MIFSFIKENIHPRMTTQKMKTCNGKIRSTFILREPSGKEIHLKGAGLLPYIPSTSCSEGGFIFLIENEPINQRMKKTLTDFGGKYEWTDCDIFQTIKREFSEETYNTFEISRDELLSVPNENKIFIENYLCVLYDASMLDMNDRKIEKARKRVVFSNPSVPDYFYRTESILYLSFSQVYKLLKQDNDFSQRVIHILKKLFSNTNFYFTEKMVLQVPDFLRIINDRIILNCDIDWEKDMMFSSNKHCQDVLKNHFDYYDENQKVLISRDKRFFCMKQNFYLSDTELKVNWINLPFIIPNCYNSSENYLENIPKEILQYIFKYTVGNMKITNHYHKKRIENLNKISKKIKLIVQDILIKNTVSIMV